MPSERERRSHPQVNRQSTPFNDDGYCRVSTFFLEERGFRVMTRVHHQPAVTVFGKPRELFDPGHFKACFHKRLNERVGHPLRKLMKGNNTELGVLPNVTQIDIEETQSAWPNRSKTLQNPPSESQLQEWFFHIALKVVDQVSGDLH